MKRRIISFIILALVIATVLTVFVGAETSEVTEGLFFDHTPESALATLIVIVSILGIALPIVPIVISLLKLFREKCEYALPYYVMFIASAIWCASGIVILILMLI